ncbi:MAG: hypothetical protein LBP26_06505 [Clostridiales bacterium]|jgi:ABC-type sugar transport system permease subunit|nr:hypothetical protein [Clostridiales bacterium]
MRENASQLKRKFGGLYAKEKAAAVLFIVIPVVGFAIFTAGTMIMTGIYSFMDFRGIDNEMKYYRVKELQRFVHEQAARRQL